MLKKLRTWTYENWLAVFGSFLISFLFLKFIFLAIFLYLIFLWHFRGSFFQSLFYSLFFLISVFNFSQVFVFFKLLIPVLFLFLFFSFKKNKLIDWLSFFIVLILLFYFNFSGNLDLILTILLSTLAVIHFSLVFLNKQLISSLILGLFFLELAFLAQFLPFNFWIRISILLVLLVLFFKKIKFDMV